MSEDRVGLGQGDESAESRVRRLIPELVAAIVDLAAEGATERQRQRVDTLLSVERSAEILGVSRTTVFGLLGSGELTSMRVRGRRLIPMSAVNDFLRRAASAPLGRTPMMTGSTK